MLFILAVGALAFWLGSVAAIWTATDAKGTSKTRNRREQRRRRLHKLTRYAEGLNREWRVDPTACLPPIPCAVETQTDEDLEDGMVEPPEVDLYLPEKQILERRLWSLQSLCENQNWTITGVLGNVKALHVYSDRLWKALNKIVTYQDVGIAQELFAHWKAYTAGRRSVSWFSMSTSPEVASASTMTEDDVSADGVATSAGLAVQGGIFENPTSPLVPQPPKSDRRVLGRSRLYSGYGTNALLGDSQGVGVSPADFHIIDLVPPFPGRSCRVAEAQTEGGVLVVAGVQTLEKEVAHVEVQAGGHAADKVREIKNREREQYVKYLTDTIAERDETRHRLNAVIVCSFWDCEAVREFHLDDVELLREALMREYYRALVPFGNDAGLNTFRAMTIRRVERDVGRK